MNRRLFAFAAMSVGAVICFAAFNHRLLAEDSASVLATDMPLRSGPQAGQEVPSFFVRVITGPQMNRSVCFVCRNGDRPVVMVVLRRLENGSSAVLKAVDALIDRRRADGLRAFGVMLSDEPAKVAPRLQTISFDEKLNMPLSVGPETLADRETLSVDSAASVTIVIYRERKVIWTAALRSSELRDEDARTRRVREIIERAELLLSGD